MPKNFKLIILDRDGVINYESPHYIQSDDEWHPIAGSLEAIARLKQSGYTVVVATNQSGIARGYYSENTLKQIHQKMIDLLSVHNATFNHIFYCPHHPNDHCACRKPQPSMLLKACRLFSVPPEKALMIGDRKTDEQAALAAGTAFCYIHETYQSIPRIPQVATHSSYTSTAQAEYKRNETGTQHNRSLTSNGVLGSSYTSLARLVDVLITKKIF